MYRSWMISLSFLVWSFYISAVTSNAFVNCIWGILIHELMLTNLFFFYCSASADWVILSNIEGLFLHEITWQHFWNLFFKLIRDYMNENPAFCQFLKGWCFHLLQILPTSPTVVLLILQWFKLDIIHWIKCIVVSPLISNWTMTWAFIHNIYHIVSILKDTV